ncbi:MAG TPA: hypothetical protein VNP92_18865 [Actinophytocola sp.]|nr:hypothetical protein [Actinophytocola sp.]
MNRTALGRLAAGGTIVVGLVLGGSAAAMAQPASDEPEPGSVTITLNAEQVTWLCDKRLPKIEKRTGKLVERITGDAETRGSAAWLRAKAEEERTAGRETSAQLLEERADRRESKVDKLNQINKWAADFRTEHCGTK